MKNDAETGKRLYLENVGLRLALKTVVSRLEAFCKWEEKREECATPIKTRLARREIRLAREALGTKR